jgi:hypothetical protein
MKKFIFTFACILYSFLTFSQEFISYDFENLNDGNLNSQDNWQVMSSQPNVNNGNMCPPNLGTETPPIITNIQGTKTITILNSTSLLEYNKEINTYPNPFEDYILLTKSENVKQIQITSISGKTMYKGIYKQRINTENYNQGIYIISLNYLDGYKQNLMMIKNF